MKIARIRIRFRYRIEQSYRIGRRRVKFWLREQILRSYREPGANRKNWLGARKPRELIAFVVAIPTIFIYRYKAEAFLPAALPRWNRIPLYVLFGYFVFNVTFLGWRCTVEAQRVITPPRS